MDFCCVRREKIFETDGNTENVRIVSDSVIMTCDVCAFKILKITARTCDPNSLMVSYMEHMDMYPGLRTSKYICYTNKQGRHICLGEPKSSWEKWNIYRKMVHIHGTYSIECDASDTESDSVWPSLPAVDENDKDILNFYDQLRDL